ncbi:nuclear pore complex protein NUP205, partial [Tanacetum coccineum]
MQGRYYQRFKEMQKLLLCIYVFFARCLFVLWHISVIPGCGNRNPIERKTWFPDIEPLNLGGLRDSIATFIHVSPILKDTIWGFLEQYDLPVVVGPQVYDMRFELNEVEARSEHYPSTISFLNLLNSLIAEERDATDSIFRFIYDYAVGPFSQSAYADPSEKWQLGVSCLQYFQ